MHYFPGRRTIANIVYSAFSTEEKNRDIVSNYTNRLKKTYFILILCLFKPTLWHAFLSMTLFKLEFLKWLRCIADLLDAIDW